VGQPAPLDGLRRGGYRLVYSDKPSDFQKDIEKSLGKKFGADWFGKLKTVLQMSALTAIFVVQSLRNVGTVSDLIPTLETIQLVLVWAMLAATVGSLVQYTAKAAKALR
jgi:CDP-diacylglycerol--glycerol-3-phosphate 3-phosphatidyltransferase